MTLLTKFVAVLAATAWVLTGATLAEAARRPTHKEAVGIIRAVHRYSRFDRVVRSRISSNDESYGAAKVIDGRNGHTYTLLLERGPWRVVNECLSAPIYEAVRDLHASTVEC
jgi:hypothetical protein